MAGQFLALSVFLTTLPSPVIHPHTPRASSHQSPHTPPLPPPDLQCLTNQLAITAVAGHRPVAGSLVLWGTGCSGGGGGGGGGGVLWSTLPAEDSAALTNLAVRALVPLVAEETGQLKVCCGVGGLRNSRCVVVWEV